MGRKKIIISRIGDERSRQITFSKRKHGLLKKAYELSVLCDVDVALIVIGNNQKLYQYASSNINEILMKYTEIQEPYESKTNADVHEDVIKRESRQGGQRESPDEDGDDSYGETFPPAPSRYAPQGRHMGAVPSPGGAIANPGMPVAMPVAVPVSASNSPKHSGSSSDVGSLSPLSATESPNMGKVMMGMPFSVGMPMAPPKLPPRLQTIRSSQLKLHLPGGGTVKLPSADASKNKPNTVGEALAEVSNDGSEKRPKLSVVTPGMKEYSPRTNLSSLPSSMLSPSILSTLLSSGQGQMDAAGNLTIPFPFDPLNTPGFNLSTPGLASLFQDMSVPSASAGGGEALITFPVNLQNLQTTQSGGVKFGPPILVTPQPSMVETPPTFPTSMMTTHSAADQEKMGEAPDSGLSMFKRQQSLEMVQQIMQLYMQHQNAMPPNSQGGVVLSPSDMDADGDGTSQAKRRCPTPPEGNSLSV